MFFDRNMYICNQKTFCHPERGEGSRMHTVYVTEILRHYVPLNDIKKKNKNHANRHPQS